MHSSHMRIPHLWTPITTCRALPNRRRRCPADGTLALTSLQLVLCSTHWAQFSHLSGKQKVLRLTNSASLRCTSSTVFVPSHHWGLFLLLVSASHLSSCVLRSAAVPHLALRYTPVVDCLNKFAPKFLVYHVPLLAEVAHQSPPSAQPLWSAFVSPEDSSSLAEPTHWQCSRLLALLLEVQLPVSLTTLLYGSHSWVIVGVIGAACCCSGCVAFMSVKASAILARASRAFASRPCCWSGNAWTSTSAPANIDVSCTASCRASLTDLSAAVISTLAFSIFCCAAVNCTSTRARFFLCSGLSCQG